MQLGSLASIFLPMLLLNERCYFFYYLVQRSGGARSTIPRRHQHERSKPKVAFLPSDSHRYSASHSQSKKLLMHHIHIPSLFIHYITILLTNLLQLKSILFCVCLCAMYRNFGFNTCGRVCSRSSKRKRSSLQRCNPFCSWFRVWRPKSITNTSCQL